MNKIVDFFKNKWTWLRVAISAVIVFVSAAICIAISGPDTAIWSGLGVWLFPFFGFNAWSFVALMETWGIEKVRNGIYSDVLGALVGVFFTWLCLL